jgi:hypothetical protein
MAEHEPSIGQSDDWYTPPEIFDALGLTFDLDPCSPGPGHWVPARRVFTRRDNGLAQRWSGLVFMNPPFGGRNGHVPWLRRFLEHSNGIAIVRAYTSSSWFHRYAVHAETMLFPKGKTKFIRPDGSIGRAPGHGVVLLGVGEVANDALRNSGLGFVVDVSRHAERKGPPQCLGWGPFGYLNNERPENSREPPAIGCGTATAR